MNYNAIERALQEMHMSRRQLAKELGIPPATFNAAMNRKAKGGVLSSIETLRNISKILCIDLFDLLLDDDVKAELDKHDSNEVISDERVIEQLEYYDTINIQAAQLDTANGSFKLPEYPESLLLAGFNRLNDAGKAEAIKRILEMTELPRYKADSE